MRGSVEPHLQSQIVLGCHGYLESLIACSVFCKHCKPLMHCSYVQLSRTSCRSGEEGRERFALYLLRVLQASARTCNVKQ